MWQSKLEDPHRASYDAELDSSRSPAPPRVAVNAKCWPSAVGAALDSPNPAFQRLSCHPQLCDRDPAACRAVHLVVTVDPATTQPSQRPPGFAVAGTGIFVVRLGRGMSRIFHSVDPMPVRICRTHRDRMGLE